MSRLRWEDSPRMSCACMAALTLLAVALWFGLPALIGFGMLSGWW